MRGETLIGAGIILILLGFLLVFVGTLVSALGEGDVEGGGVIMIGPIPIVFGTSRGALTLVSILAVLLMLLWIVGVLLARRG